MAVAPNQPELPGRANTSVVLLIPELFATTPDHAALQVALSQQHTRFRLLVRLATRDDLDLAEALAQAGVAVEVLVPDGIAVRSTDLPLARMPPGSSETDTNELALALSDLLLIGSDSPDIPLIRLARDLKKPFITPETKLPPLAGVQHGIAHRLDPEQPGWHLLLRWGWGRLEQFCLELAAFNWQSPTYDRWQSSEHDGVAKSLGSLRACLPGWELNHKAYFAPEESGNNWKPLAPDRAALDTTSPLVASFDRLDRGALHGSYVHRDLAWVGYAAAAFAVFFAVAGHTRLWPHHPEKFWSWCEFVALFIILGTTAYLLIARLQDRWTACRSGAEQLRIARMCLPLLVAPGALCTEDEPAKGNRSKQALAEVKRAVRDHGLPHLSAKLSPIDAARWLECLVADQCSYHHNNHLKLDRAEQRMNWVAIILFVFAFAAVCWPFLVCDSEYLLILTAAGPAFGAAAHGVTTRLGLVHRVQLSHDAEGELLFIRDKIRAVIAHPPTLEKAWADVRHLAFLASEAMGRETTSWHSQVRRQKDALP
jgi:hypothetical protein